MIEVKNLTKRFHDFTALEDVSCSIGSGCIYGMVGSNGAGKSTFLRALTGVYQPDAGKILIDGQPVWDNPAVKRRIAYVPDELYFLAGANLNRMERMYQSLYPDFDKNRFEKLCGHLQLPRNKSLGQFSKGMRRQAATILALSCRPDYLFFDETFDGLDPVMRRQVWSLMMGDVAERGTTVLVSSHNLRELEDVCDHVGIMDHGHVLLERSLAQLQDNMVKLQVVFPDGMEDVPAELPVLHASKLGRVHTLIMRMNAQEATERLMAYSPLLVDAVPLTLEEIFIYELGGADYAVKDIVL